MENSNPWTTQARRPFIGLISNILFFALYPVLFEYELLVMDPLSTGIIVLCGGTAWFLWGFIHAKLYDKCSCILRTLFASPFVAGFCYAIFRLGYLNDQLGNPEATFPWVLFGGISCALGIGIPLWIDRQQQSNVENTENTDAPSEIDSDSALTEPTSDE